MSSAITSFPEDLQPVDWKSINDAIFDWLARVVPQVDRRIRMERQDLNQPPYPYLTYLLDSANSEFGVPSLVEETDLTAPLGEEQLRATFETMTATLSISAFVEPGIAASDVKCNAKALLTKARNSLGQLSVLDLLGGGGISVVRAEAVIDTSVIMNGKWDSRATLDVIIRFASVMTEKTGFIDKVEVTAEPEPGQTILVDAS